MEGKPRSWQCQQILENDDKMTSCRIIGFQKRGRGRRFSGEVRFLNGHSNVFLRMRWCFLGPQITENGCSLVQVLKGVAQALCSVKKRVATEERCFLCVIGA